MKAPKLILIGRQAIKNNLDEVKQALAPINLGGAVVACHEDADAAKQVTEGVFGFPEVVAIVADFNFPLGVIFDDGSVEPIELHSEKPEERPLIQLVE